LENLTKEIDIYLSQHAIFVNKLEKYINGKEKNKPDFVDCHSCAFGKLLDKVIEKKDIYPDNIKKILEELKEIHCNFHKEAFLIENEEDPEKKKEILKKIKDYSTKLFQYLLKLKQVSK